MVWASPQTKIEKFDNNLFCIFGKILLETIMASAWKFTDWTRSFSSEFVEFPSLAWRSRHLPPRPSLLTPHPPHNWKKSPPPLLSYSCLFVQHLFRMFRQVLRGGPSCETKKNLAAERVRLTPIPAKKRGIQTLSCSFSGKNISPARF